MIRILQNLPLLIVLVVMWLKLVEIVFHLIRVYPKGTIAGGTPQTYVRREWPVTALIATVASLLRIPKWLQPYAFRFKILMPMLIVLSFFADTGCIAMIAGITLYCAIWVPLLRILADQVKYGSASYLRGPFIPNPLFIKKFGGPSPQPKLRSFLHLFLGLTATVIMGFSALYNLCQMQSGDAFLENNGQKYIAVPNDGWAIVHFTYFSIVTLATVGFGDIMPAPSPHVLPRFLVGSEIIAGILVLIVFLTTVSLTFQESESSNQA